MVKLAVCKYIMCVNSCENTISESPFSIGRHSAKRFESSAFSFKLHHIEKELGRKFLPSSFSYGRSSAAKSLVCEVLSDMLLVSG